MTQLIDDNEYNDVFEENGKLYIWVSILKYEVLDKTLRGLKREMIKGHYIKEDKTIILFVK